MELAATAFARLRSSRAANISWPRQTPWFLAAAFALLVGWSTITWPQQFMTGLIIGSLYALSAVGLTLIYSIAKTPHFAHGDAMMLTAYLTFFALTGVLVGGGGSDARLPIRLDQLPGSTDQIWRFSFGYGFPLAMLIAVIIAVPLLLAINTWIYRPLLARNSGTAIVAVASLGVAIAMRGFILLIWGSTPRKYVTGIRDTVEVWRFPRVVADQYFILAASLVLSVIVSWILFRTRLGTSMRAMADNPDLARASGIITAHVTRWTWVIGSVLITVAGTLLALQSQLSADLGFVLLLPIFASAILGGVGSPQGAFLGGLVIGVASELTVGMGLVSPGYKLSVAFIVLILVILIRPRGLLGVR